MQISREGTTITGKGLAVQMKEESAAIRRNVRVVITDRAKSNLATLPEEQVMRSAALVLTALVALGAAASPLAAQTKAPAPAPRRAAARSGRRAQARAGEVGREGRRGPGRTPPS